MHVNYKIIKIHGIFINCQKANNVVEMFTMHPLYVPIYRRYRGYLRLYAFRSRPIIVFRFITQLLFCIKVTKLFSVSGSTLGFNKSRKTLFGFRVNFRFQQKS